MKNRIDITSRALQMHSLLRFLYISQGFNGNDAYDMALTSMALRKTLRDSCIFSELDTADGMIIRGMIQTQRDKEEAGKQNPIDRQSRETSDEHN